MRLSSQIQCYQWRSIFIVGSQNLETLWGLSGPSLKPIALRMTYQCAKSVSIPIIGCGGISTVEDIIEYLIAGATAIQVGTATFINPNAMVTLLADLESFLQKQNIQNISDLIGSVRDEDAADEVVFMETTP